jgi:hypothetical protein
MTLKAQLAEQQNRLQSAEMSEQTQKLQRATELAEAKMRGSAAESEIALRGTARQAETQTRNKAEQAEADLREKLRREREEAIQKAKRIGQQILDPMKRLGKAAGASLWRAGKHLGTSIKQSHHQAKTRAEQIQTIQELRELGALEELPSGKEGVKVTLTLLKLPPSPSLLQMRIQLRGVLPEIQAAGGLISLESISTSTQTAQAILPTPEFAKIAKSLSEHDIGIDIDTSMLIPTEEVT